MPLPTLKNFTHRGLPDLKDKCWIDFLLYVWPFTLKRVNKQKAVIKGLVHVSKITRTEVRVAAAEPSDVRALILIQRLDRVVIQWLLLFHLL